MTGNTMPTGAKMIPYSRIGNLKNHILSRGSLASALVLPRTWTLLGLVQPVKRLRLEASDRGWKGPEGSELAEIEGAEGEKEWGGGVPPPLSLLISFFLFLPAYSLPRSRQGSCSQAMPVTQEN